MTNSDSKRERITGTGIPLPGNDIDTDRIIPARFLRCVTFDGLGENAFYDERFDANGQPREHPFNDERFRNGSILIVNKNFGCGSSREHAPQALMRFGIRAIVGESFAEIFFGNCIALGIPAVTCAQKDIAELMAWVREHPAEALHLDLTTASLAYNDCTIRIDLPETSRNALVSGKWDTLTQLLANRQEIEQTAARLPYLNGFPA